MVSKTVGTLLNGIRRSVPLRSQEAAMMRYRNLLLGLLGLSLVGCAGYDYDDNRNYGRSGYGTVYSAPYVQRYEVYSAPRYHRAPAPRYYVPAPAPRYYSTPRRAPIYNGWNQPPRGYYPAPHRYDHKRDNHRDRYHARDRDNRRGEAHRGHDRRGEHRSDHRNGHGDWRQRNR